MPIFGQVWLWSSLAFLLGALLCWLLVAYPARKRVGELENELATRSRRQPPERSPSLDSARRATNEMEEDFARAMVPGLGDRYADDQSEYLTRAYALRDVPEAEPPRQSFPDLTRSTAATQYLNVASTALPEPPRQLQAPPEVPPPPTAPPPPSDRGWFDDELRGAAAAHDQLADQPTQFNEPAHFSEPVFPGRLTESELPVPGSLDARLVDDEAEEPVPDRLLPDEPRSAIEDDSGGTVFTQQTRPIPAELIRQIDQDTSADAALVDDLADEPAEEADPRDHTVESEPVPAPASLAEAPSDEPTGVSNGVTPPFPPVISRPEPVGEPTEIVPAVTPTASEPVSREEYVITPGVTVQVEQTPSQLPKRVPSKPQHRTPFGVQTQDPEPSPPAAAESSVSEPTRALFEPIVPAGDATPVPPPPHRMREGTNGQPTRGPFGPGSAMPLPGGASPSPDYTIKASVAALRYCTPDSPQFGRTVAEVWFRTAADAERVGFRPVG